MGLMSQGVCVREVRPKRRTHPERGEGPALSLPKGSVPGRNGFFSLRPHNDRFPAGFVGVMLVVLGVSSAIVWPVLGAAQAPSVETGPGASVTEPHGEVVGTAEKPPGLTTTGPAFQSPVPGHPRGEDEPAPPGRTRFIEEPEVAPPSTVPETSDEPGGATPTVEGLSGPEDHPSDRKAAPPGSARTTHDEEPNR